MGQPVEKLRRDGSQLPRAVVFTGPWSRGPHLSKVLLGSSNECRASRLHWLPLVCVSWPFEDTRRFSLSQKRQETESKWLQAMVPKVKAPPADPASLPI